MAHIEYFGQDGLQVSDRKEFLAWASECFEDVVDRVVFLQDNFLLVDFHGALEVNTVVEELH